MTTRPDGGIDCDNCGRDVGAGSLRQALHVGDLDPVNVGQVRNLRFCRRRDDDPEGFDACADLLLDGKTRHLDQLNETARQEAESARVAAQEAQPAIPDTYGPPDVS